METLVLFNLILILIIAGALIAAKKWARSARACRLLYHFHGMRRREKTAGQPLV